MKEGKTSNPWQIHSSQKSSILLPYLRVKYLIDSAQRSNSAWSFAVQPVTGPACIALQTKG